MSDVKWLGKADPIAQIDTTQITADDAATTYKITINGEVVSVLGSGTGVNDTAAALQVALEASTSAYFTSIAWTVTTDTITATAGFAGNPHTAVSSVTGGTGTIGAVTNTTASSGPNDWDVPRNWDTGSVPVSTDNVIIEDTNVSITHGLAQSAVTLASLVIKKSFTGRIGLKEMAFATSSDGATIDPLKEEYKDQYLAIGATILKIGENFTERPQDGSTFIKINVGSVQTTATVYDTASTAFEANRPAVQLLGTHASNALFIRDAKGSVGVAVSGFEISTFLSIDIGAEMSGGGVILGSGVTLTTWSQKSGTHHIEAAADITTVDIFGGTLTTEGGDYKIVTVNVGSGGKYFPNHVNAGGVTITTLNFLTGTSSVDTTQSSRARTFTTVNLFSEATLESDDKFVTITNLLEPSGPYIMTLD